MKIGRLGIANQGACSRSDLAVNLSMSNTRRPQPRPLVREPLIARCERAGRPVEVSVPFFFSLFQSSGETQQQANDAGGPPFI